MELKNVCFSYGKNVILKDISFSLEPGRCLAVAGPNGRGKSTLLLVIAGILHPRQGEVSVDMKTGYVPQGGGLFEDMTVKDNFRFFSDMCGCEMPSPLPFELDEYASRKVSALSGGTKKRVSIACALLGDPELILFDEPCASLDVTYRDEIIELATKLKSEGKSIIYVGHDTAEFSDFYDSLLFLGREHAEMYTSEQFSRGHELADNYKELMQKENTI